MKKRIIIITVIFILISAAVITILSNSQDSGHFRHCLSVNVTVNGEKLDLTGTSVQCSYVHTAEPPKLITTYEILRYNDDDYFTAEYNSTEYSHYYYEFMLPVEKTGFGRNITVRVGEEEIDEAYKTDGLNVDLNLTFTDAAQANAEMYIARGMIVDDERILSKQLTLEDASIDYVFKRK